MLTVFGATCVTECWAGSKRTPATGVTFADHSQALRWARLEEAAVANGGTPSPIFRPTLQCFTNNTDNKLNPTTFVGGQSVCEEGWGWGIGCVWTNLFRLCGMFSVSCAWTCPSEVCFTISMLE